MDALAGVVAVQVNPTTKRNVIRGGLFSSLFLGIKKNQTLGAFTIPHESLLNF